MPVGDFNVLPCQSPRRMVSGGEDHSCGWMRAELKDTLRMTNRPGESRTVSLARPEVTGTAPVATRAVGLCATTGTRIRSLAMGAGTRLQTPATPSRPGQGAGPVYTSRVLHACARSRVGVCGCVRILGAARLQEGPHRARNDTRSRACALGCADVCGIEGHTQDGQSTTRIGNTVSCGVGSDWPRTRCNSGGRAAYDDRNADPEFGDGCRDALADAGDALQAGARSRAYIYFARVSRSRAIARWSVRSVRILGAARLQKGTHRARNDTPARPGGAEHRKSGSRHSGKAA